MRIYHILLSSEARIAWLQRVKSIGHPNLFLPISFEGAFWTQNVHFLSHSSSFSSHSHSTIQYYSLCLLWIYPQYLHHHHHHPLSLLLRLQRIVFCLFPSFARGMWGRYLGQRDAEEKREGQMPNLGWSKHANHSTICLQIASRFLEVSKEQGRIKKKKRMDEREWKREI